MTNYFHSHNFSENLPSESTSISNNPIKLSRNDKLPTDLVLAEYRSPNTHSSVRVDSFD